jgi:hypothetical protein
MYRLPYVTNNTLLSPPWFFGWVQWMTEMAHNSYRLSPND